MGTKLDKLVQDIEVLKESIELAKLGLTEEEIEGYFAFYLHNYKEELDEYILAFE